MADKRWEADSSTSLRRLGKSSHELGQTSQEANCPDIWELHNGTSRSSGKTSPRPTGHGSRPV